MNLCFANQAGLIFNHLTITNLSIINRTVDLFDPTKEIQDAYICIVPIHIKEWFGTLYNYSIHVNVTICGDLFLKQLRLLY